MSAELKRMACPQGKCEGYDLKIDMSEFEAAVEAMDAARDAHCEAHRPVVTHIRRQVNPRRIRTGNQFYKDLVKLNAAEDGSQTLCGAEPTSEDMSWGETRFEKNLAYAGCEACRDLRRAS